MIVTLFKQVWRVPVYNFARDAVHAAGAASILWFLSVMCARIFFCLVALEELDRVRACDHERHKGATLEQLVSLRLAVRLWLVSRGLVHSVFQYCCSCLLNLLL